MPDVVIREVDVRFPFEPYDVQKAYMSKVIECLQNVSVTLFILKQKVGLV